MKKEIKEIKEIPEIKMQEADVPVVEEKKGKEAIKEKPAKKKKTWLKFLLIGILALVLILGGLGIFSYFTFKSLLVEQGPIKEDLSQMKVAIKEQNLGKIKESSQKLNEDLERLQGKVKSFAYLSPLPVVGNYYQDANHLMVAGQAGLNAADLVVEAITPYADILGLGGEKTASAEGKTALDRIGFLVTTLDKIRPELDKIGGELQKAREEMDQIDPKRYPQEIKGMKIRENLSLAITTIDQASSLVNDAKPMIEVTPELFGVDAPKFYLVLFQNDAELRPTGGFLTAYGVLKVDKGKITPILSEDIYSLDAKFNKKLPAPDPIKKYHKNVPYFYLRDMNLSPDFAVSMQQFTEIYNNQIPGATKVDGVIAVDTKFLTALLKVLGPIGVPEWGNFSAEIDKRCDCPQVVYRLEEIADKPVSAVVTSRKAVIGPLMHSILANAFNSPKTKIAELFNAGLTAIQEKHILFYLYDEKAQKAAEAFNLAGRVRDYEGDYQLLVDTNFAGAKSNLFIKQNIEEKIEVSSTGEVTKTILIIYDNPFPASDCNLESGGLCLNGLYRDWIRLYVPKGSELIEVTGSEVTANTYEDLGKTVFEAFYGDKYPLRPQSSTKVSFKYKLPFRVEKGEPYKLLIQKQPGVEKYDFNLDFNGAQQEFELRTDKEIKL